MSRISATQILLENQQLKEQIAELQEELDTYKTHNRASNKMIDELDQEIARLEELCHANGISI